MRNNIGRTNCRNGPTIYNNNELSVDKGYTPWFFNRLRRYTSFVLTYLLLYNFKFYNIDIFVLECQPSHHIMVDGDYWQRPLSSIYIYVFDPLTPADWLFHAPEQTTATAVSPSKDLVYETVFLLHCEHQTLHWQRSGTNWRHFCSTCNCSYSAFTAF